MRRCKGGSVYPVQERIRDARLSFVSGHASLSVYSMSFSVLYLQARMGSRDFRLVKPLIQVTSDSILITDSLPTTLLPKVGCVFFAFFTSLSRVSDYKHHPEVGPSQRGSPSPPPRTWPVELSWALWSPGWLIASWWPGTPLHRLEKV